jgi:prolyl oligopeptidase
MFKTATWAIVILLADLAASGPPPETAKNPVTDVYHGVSVQDDYRWLENWSDPEVRKWSETQNAYARRILDRLPAREEIGRRVRELEASPAPSYFALFWRNGTLFALKDEPPKQQPFLVALKSADNLESERVLVDPNRIDIKGGTSIDWFVPSLDGKLVAVSMSEGGSEIGTVRVFEAQTGTLLPDVIPRANAGTAGGSLAWSSGSAGFFYTRYPRTGERSAEDMDFYQQVYFHKLGTPTGKDTYSLGRNFPRIAETQLQSSEDGRYLLASVKNGDGGEVAQFLRTPAGSWVSIAAYADKAIVGRFGSDGALYLLSRKDAPRGRILRVPLEVPSLEKAGTVVSEGENVIERFSPTRTSLYVVEIAGGPTRLRIFDLRGHLRTEPQILPVSYVGGIVPLSDDDVLFSNQSCVVSPAWYRAAPGGSVVRTALAFKSPADFRDTEVIREAAISKDGTKIPLTILARRGVKRDRSNPTILSGYGGYGISMYPFFEERLRIWIEQGGVWVTANLRGGGEFGETWHLAGNLTKKQNVFDDFLACASWLIDKGYTSPERLGIEGGSNGGLLMGAALTQRPDLFRAVVSYVGIYDMLRVELSSNGAFNVTEYGTVKDPGQFRALFAYSPYHHVTDGREYPAVLFLTGANDPRVDPMQSRKMTARLQAAGSSAPILLRTSSSSGHGFGTALDEELAQETDEWSFLFWQLGVKYQAVQTTTAAGS